MYVLEVSLSHIEIDALACCYYLMPPRTFSFKVKDAGESSKDLI